MFAIIDCNNFYASCERLFKPALAKKPVVVLSNNDGCIIARSNEAKALGIKMGEPYFKIKALCQQQKVQVFSSNYAFYGDMSQRVMQVIAQNWPEVEIYSIDEAFLDLSTLNPKDCYAFCQQLQQKVKQYTGIPVSIGIGETKTLAKLANHIAKKELKIPVFTVSAGDPWLSKIAVSDVWGVGRQWNRQLAQLGIFTAADLANANLRWIKSHFNVILQRTVLELQGTPCIPLDEQEAPSKSIISSRSFGSLQSSCQALEQSISTHCELAWEKLREQHLAVGHISVFIWTNRFREDLPQYQPSLGLQLLTPTDDLREIIRNAKQCLKKIFKAGYLYKKAGVYFTDLRPKDQRQLDLFYQPEEKILIQTEQLMTVFEKINNKYGRHTLKIAAQGFNQNWAMRTNLRSPRYTTHWLELPIAF